MKKLHLSADKIKQIKAIAKKLKYWKFDGVEIKFHYDGEKTTEYMSLTLYDNDEPFIRRGSDSFYAEDKIEPIVEGHQLLNEILKG